MTEVKQERACSFCGSFKTDLFCGTCNSETPSAIHISVHETVNVRESFELKGFVRSPRNFIAHFIGGWFPSKREDLSPDGVYKEQLVDRRGNRYRKLVRDVMTGRIIKDVDERLSDHKKQSRP